MNDEYKKMLERFEQICQNAKKELCSKEEKEQEKRFIEKINKELTINEYDEIENWLASVEALDNNAINDILEENKRLNNIINKGIEAINVYQNEKTLSVGYQDLKRIRGILRGNKFDLERFEDYLQELKGSSNNE